MKTFKTEVEQYELIFFKKYTSVKVFKKFVQNTVENFKKGYSKNYDT